MMSSSRGRISATASQLRTPVAADCRWPGHSLSVAVVCWGLLAGSVAAQEIKLLGSVSWSGTAADRSGLSDVLEGEIPHNRLGGFSGIEYTGKGHEYLLVPDRGPTDGATKYATRFHAVEIKAQPGQTPALLARLVTTTPLVDEDGNSLLGWMSAVDYPNPGQDLRFDPEGVRLAEDGTVWISDEYGPFVYGFDNAGRRTQVLNMLGHYIEPATLAAPKSDTGRPESGRQDNKGMEGLAITPDGRRLYGLMQGPLFQDGPLDENGKRAGLHCRMLEIEPSTGATREFIYPLDYPSAGLSELLAVSDREFLVIERDGKNGREAAIKKIYHVDLADATDISGAGGLPPKQLPAGVRAVRKRLLIDMLDPRFHLVGDAFPQKVEGLAFGPTLPDGQRLLIVCVDNDFKAELQSLFYAFAIPREMLPNFAWKY